MTLAKITVQIAASREHLRELRRQRNLEILRLFDDELLSSKQISQRMKISDNAVRQFLWSRGRTKRGRESVRSQLAILQETMK